MLTHLIVVNHHEFAEQAPGGWTQQFGLRRGWRRGDPHVPDVSGSLLKEEAGVLTARPGQRDLGASMARMSNVRSALQD